MPATVAATPRTTHCRSRPRPALRLMGHRPQGTAETKPADRRHQATDIAGKTMRRHTHVLEPHHPTTPARQRVNLEPGNTTDRPAVLVDLTTTRHITGWWPPKRNRHRIVETERPDTRPADKPGPDTVSTLRSDPHPRQRRPITVPGPVNQRVPDPPSGRMDLKGNGEARHRDASSHTAFTDTVNDHPSAAAENPIPSSDGGNHRTRPHRRPHRHRCLPGSERTHTLVGDADQHASVADLGPDRGRRPCPRAASPKAGVNDAMSGLNGCK